MDVYYCLKIRNHSEISRALLGPIIDIFRVKWLVIWRYRVINKSSKYLISDSFIRLLSFPDYTNTSEAEDKILHLTQSNFFSDIYTYYVNGGRHYEDDPEYNSISTIYLSQILQRSLSRVSSDIHCFFNNRKGFPKSEFFFQQFRHHYYHGFDVIYLDLLLVCEKNIQSLNIHILLMNHSSLPTPSPQQSRLMSLFYKNQLTLFQLNHTGNLNYILFQYQSETLLIITKGANLNMLTILNQIRKMQSQR